MQFGAVVSGSINQRKKRIVWQIQNIDFNEHRANYFIPGSTICINESMVKWYEYGGGWINRGLPHYMEIDRKLENGLENQNASCGDTWIMIWLKLVKGGGSEEEDGADDDTLHDAKCWWSWCSLRLNPEE